MAPRAKKPRQTPAQQRARKNVLEYVRRLGKRKAANRLNVDVKTLTTWLEKGIPSKHLETARKLGQPLAGYVSLGKSRLDAFIAAVGVRKAASLTGKSQKELLAEAKKRPGKKVAVSREKLAKALKGKTNREVAEQFGLPTRSIYQAAKVPRTTATVRLEKASRLYGHEALARRLGVDKTTLSRWIARGLPRTWEPDVNAVLGQVEKHKVIDEKSLKRGSRNIQREIREALSKARAWNKKAPAHHRIKLSDAERWARLGTFQEKLTAAKQALAAAKKPVKKTRRKPPPPKPRITTEIPEGVLLPEAKKPPTKVEEAEEESEEGPELPPEVEVGADVKKEFLQARAEAFFEGRYPKPGSPWGRLSEWRLVNREGIRIYKRIENFVSDVDLERLGKELLTLTQKVWGALPGDDSSFLTIRLVLSMRGLGNPFYKDAFVADSKVSFTTRKEDVTSTRQIPVAIDLLMDDVYTVDSETTMLFLEYIEIIKSRRRA